MKEIHSIIRAYNEALAQGRQMALATVVHLEGSSYRRPGARMLVTDEGRMTGAISGGCLEGDALQKALFVMSSGKAKLVSYDTSDEDDVSIGVQLGCNGIVQILIEPLDPADENNPVNLLKKIIAKRQHVVLVTVFEMGERSSGRHGTCLLLEESGKSSYNKSGEELNVVVMQDAAAALQQKSSSYKNYPVGNSILSAFLELIKPVVSIVIVGAGNDAIPLAEMAKVLGWDIYVVDGRPTHATAERFGSSCQVLVAKPEKVLEQIPIDELTCFVLMTHNYNYDKAMVKILLQTETRYIGVLGPKKKMDRMFDELQAEGATIGAAEHEKIYSPVGLDIGSEAPEEIALSVIAEIKAVMSGSTGHSLRDKTEVIHWRDAEKNPMPFQQISK